MKNLETEPGEIARKIKAMQNLQELEAQKERDRSEGAGLAPDYFVVVLEERIGKAREILKALLPEQLEGYSKDEVKRALKMLEGKYR